jgi:hypothetical protein
MKRQSCTCSNCHNISLWEGQVAYQRPDWHDRILSSTGLRVASDAALPLEEFALGQKQLIVLLILRRIRLSGLRDFAARWPRRADGGLMMKTVRVTDWQQKELAAECISEELSLNGRAKNRFSILYFNR